MLARAAAIVDGLFTVGEGEEREGGINGLMARGATGRRGEEFTGWAAHIEELHFCFRL